MGVDNKSAINLDNYGDKVSQFKKSTEDSPIQALAVDNEKYNDATENDRMIMKFAQAAFEKAAGEIPVVGGAISEAIGSLDLSEAAKKNTDARTLKIEKTVEAKEPVKTIKLPSKK